ncbi:MAG TPA: hypothetical protein VJ761_14190 [Ktedonobacteraceae bacterium]|nr:hypothetical protein [Ktedonobacteraceae bacterium]
MLKPEVIKRMEEYALGHCPFSGCKIWEKVEFEITETTRFKNSAELEGTWFVHAWIPTVQASYGLFVAVWKDGDVGGVIEFDGTQKIFEYYPPQTGPIVRNWGRHEK